MMKKKQSIAVLIVAVILTALLGWTVIRGWGPTGTGAMKNINLGLDLFRRRQHHLPGGAGKSFCGRHERYKIQAGTACLSVQHRGSGLSAGGHNRITIDIPGATDANEILTELGKPGSLYFIAETDADGNQNYVYDSTVGNYVLNNKTLEDLQNDGSVVLTGQDLENAEAVHQQDSTTQATTAAVQLRLTDEGAEKFAAATEKAAEAGETIGIYYDEEFVSVPTVNDAITDGVASISRIDGLGGSVQPGGDAADRRPFSGADGAGFQRCGRSLGSEAVSTRACLQVLWDCL